MRLDEPTCRERLTAARVAHLATAGADAVPHVVPVTFAVVAGEAGDEIVSAIDRKPKTTTNLRRLRNIRANPPVTVLCDQYAEDWTRLWWVRADGVARVEAEESRAVEALVAKYPQYADDPPTGPLIVVRVTRWSGWSASED